MLRRSSSPGVTHRPPRAKAMSVPIDIGLRRYMLGIYGYMALALVVSGAVAFFAAQSQAFIDAVYVMNGDRIAGMQPAGWVIALSPLGLAMLLGFGLQRMSLTAAQAAYWTFAVVMGLSLTTIALAYTATSIAQVFFVAAATFGLVSLYGYTTRRNLGRLGGFLMMAVIGLVVAALVNLLLQNTVLQFALSALGVLVFTGLTAFETQRLKILYAELAANGEAMQKVMIIGALSLYINFINIFTSLMHLIGERR